MQPLHLLAVLVVVGVVRTDSSERVPVSCQRDLQVVALPGDPEPFTVYVCSSEDGGKVLLAAKHAYIDHLQTTLDHEVVTQLGASARPKRQVAYASATSSGGVPVVASPYYNPYVPPIVYPSNIIGNAAAIAATGASLG